jgi:hypothetical protein
MRTSAISAVIAALCKSSADASTLVRVRTQTKRKSLSSGRDAYAFLDYEPAFRQLELSMSESLSMPGADSMPGTDSYTIPAVVTVEFDEGTSG